MFKITFQVLILCNFSLFVSFISMMLKIQSKTILINLIL